MVMAKEPFAAAFDAASQKVTGHPASKASIDTAYDRLSKTAERLAPTNVVPVFSGKASPEREGEPEMRFAIFRHGQLDPTRAYYRARGSAEYIPIPT